MTERKVYLPIGTIRLLDVRIYLDDNLIYEGMIENVPEELKPMKYSEVRQDGKKRVFMVYSECNEQ